MSNDTEAKSQNGNPKILWVDDQINEIPAYVNALRERAINVDTAATAEEALEKIANQEYDAYLIDLKMPNRDGIWLIKEIEKKDRKAKRQVPAAALSSFLYRQKYREELALIGKNVEPMDKDWPPFDDPDFEARFVDPIRNLIANGVTSSIRDYETLSDVEEENPFGLSLGEFLDLSMIQKDRTIDLAQKQAEATLRKEFEEGSQWVLLCGSPTVIRKRAKSMSEIMSEDQIIALARRIGYAPFQFFRPVSVEDMWPGCNNEAPYPTVTVRLLASADSKVQALTDPLKIHFDTGSPYNFFSYEALRELGVIKPNITGFEKSFLRNGEQRPFRSTGLRIQAMLFCEKTGESSRVLLTGQAIREWQECSLARKCDAICDIDDVSPHLPKELCRFRTGLIGRSLLKDNDVVLTLHGTLGVTEVRVEKKR